MTSLRLCHPATTQQRQPGAFELPKGERAMPQTYYVAELLGVLPEPLPLELAHAVAETLAIAVEAIGTGQLGANGWGVFRVHHVVRNWAHAETAALWLARELGNPHRACILIAWAEPSQDLAGGAV